MKRASSQLPSCRPVFSPAHVHVHCVFAEAVMMYAVQKILRRDGSASRGEQRRRDGEPDPMMLPKRTRRSGGMIVKLRMLTRGQTIQFETMTFLNSLAISALVAAGGLPSRVPMTQKYR